MEILKNAWFDALVTALIAYAVFVGGSEAVRWAIVVYSPVMLLLKVVAFAGRHKRSPIKPQDPGIPVAVFHVLYAANVAILTYGAIRTSSDWWWVAGCWAIIWLLSAASGKGKPVSKEGRPTSA